MTLHRFENWPTRLNAWILDRVGMPFEWGTSDCCLFAADAVRVMTGVDLAADLRGYRTASEAARLLAEYGGVEGVATARLGAPIEPQHARRGDVVLVENAGRAALAICLGADWFGQGEQATASGPMAGALKAWRV